MPSPLAPVRPAHAFALLLTALAFAAGCNTSSGGTTGGDTDTGPACTLSRDCEGGQRCVAGSCRTICTSDEECDGGRCDPDAKVCARCVTDEHCGAGKVCDRAANACVGFCTDDVACGRGKWCAAGSCERCACSSAGATCDGGLLCDGCRCLEEGATEPRGLPCTPDERVCGGNAVARCASDGASWRLAETCDPRGSCEEGACVAPPAADGDDDTTGEGDAQGDGDVASDGDVPADRDRDAAESGDDVPVVDGDTEDAVEDGDGNDETSCIFTGCPRGERCDPVSGACVPVADDDEVPEAEEDVAADVPEEAPDTVEGEEDTRCDDVCLRAKQCDLLVPGSPLGGSETQCRARCRDFGITDAQHQCAIRSGCDTLEFCFEPPPDEDFDLDADADTDPDLDFDTIDSDAPSCRWYLDCSFGSECLRGGCVSIETPPGVPLELRLTLNGSSPSLDYDLHLVRYDLTNFTSGVGTTTDNANDCFWRNCNVSDGSNPTQHPDWGRTAWDGDDPRLLRDSVGSSGPMTEETVLRYPEAARYFVIVERYRGVAGTAGQADLRVFVNGVERHAAQNPIANGERFYWVAARIDVSSAGRVTITPMTDIFPSTTTPGGDGDTTDTDTDTTDSSELPFDLDELPFPF